MERGEKFAYGVVGETLPVEVGVCCGEPVEEIGYVARISLHGVGAQAALEAKICREVSQQFSLLYQACNRGLWSFSPFPDIWE